MILYGKKCVIRLDVIEKMTINIPMAVILYIDEFIILSFLYLLPWRDVAAISLDVCEKILPGNIFDTVDLIYIFMCV